jgi:hypothetical protein
MSPGPAQARPGCRSGTARRRLDNSSAGKNRCEEEVGGGLKP